MEYIDPLYGKLEISPVELKLFQTPELARLRDISLSAVPTIMLPWGKIASRFEHSVGVAHLASIVAQKPEFKPLGQDLIFAALLHDVGSPPFSHLTEVFLQAQLGQTHEQFAQQMLESGDVFTLIQKHGGQPQRVLKLISGQHQPFGPLIAGTIDLDNLDNTLRFGIGAGLISRLYEPENLARAFGKNSHLFIDGSVKRDIDAWEFCREQVYSAIYSDANLAAGTMLVRALEFAFKHQDIQENFFFRTDHQALYILEHNCNPATRRLTHAARLWQHYFKAAAVITTHPSPKLKQLAQDKTNWGKIADQVAQELALLPEEVAVLIDKDKGYKHIDLPIKGEATITHQPRRPLRYLMHIFLHPRHHHLKAKTQSLLQQLLAG